MSNSETEGFYRIKIGGFEDLERQKINFWPIFRAFNQLTTECNRLPLF